MECFLHDQSAGSENNNNTLNEVRNVCVVYQEMVLVSCEQNMKDGQQQEVRVYLLLFCCQMQQTKKRPVTQKLLSQTRSSIAVGRHNPK